MYKTEFKLWLGLYGRTRDLRIRVSAGKFSSSAPDPTLMSCVLAVFSKYFTQGFFLFYPFILRFILTTLNLLVSRWSMFLLALFKIIIVISPINSLITFDIKRKNKTKWNYCNTYDKYWTGINCLFLVKMH